MSEQEPTKSKEQLKKLGEHWLEALRASEQEGSNMGENLTSREQKLMEEGKDNFDNGLGGLDMEDVEMKDVEMEDVEELQDGQEMNDARRGRSSSVADDTGRSLHPPALNLHTPTEKSICQSPKTDSDQSSDDAIDGNEGFPHEIMRMDFVVSTSNMSEGELHLYGDPIYGQYRCNEPSPLRICWTAIRV
jgi:hypothetical protein